MSCAICGRAGRGYGFILPHQIPPAPMRHACSILCLDTLSRKRGDVLHLHHYERQALEAASDAAGDYLEKLGKTDLAAMSSEEWRGLIELVFVRSTATIQQLTSQDAPPF